MKQIIAISAVALGIALTGCGEKEKVYAVDMVQTAQADAIAASQPPEKVVFDDDGAALFPGTITQRTAGTTAASTQTTQTSTDEQTADNTTTEATATASVEEQSTGDNEQADTATAQ